ncbi:GNAT family N-acetyltransferase [Oscillatoria sp. CS-180]|uniref:GNAT family N-acetyltransferase n=1 Tax=Oscillatoria sp. CS-180 TaxID=3021720 RepID=UPI00232E47F7|nr:GNAT family N-acetyltransferase [Oscillatoria sp. CS-180]MDB9527041.1 GNAT family N-acetyltransferase [Oscillatoria sp. CS-180]
MQKKTQEFSLRDEIDLTTVCVAGNRVWLRSISDYFAEAIFKEFSDEITEFMIPKPAETIDDTLAFIHSSIQGMKEKYEVIFVILDKSSEEFIGCCGVHGQANARTPELGIWIKKSAHGSKLGREAIHLTCQWALETIDFDYLTYPVDRANIPSRRIPESMGGIIFEEKQVETRRGTQLDEVVYKISPDLITSCQLNP